jgi:hypothetical protein
MKKMTADERGNTNHKTCRLAATNLPETAISRGQLAGIKFLGGNGNK